MTKVKSITRIAFKQQPTGIKSVDVEYYLSTSTTELAGGSWQTTAPQWVEGHYMWSRTKTEMTDGSIVYSEPACIGGTGRGIKSIQEQYYLSTSNSSLSGGSWANTPQAWVDGKYMWTRSVITYSDNTTSTTDPVCVTGAKGATGQSSFKSIVFIRSNSTPSTPTGGSYSSPVPSGWSDGVPSGDAQLWMSTRIFTNDGAAPQQSAWTTPQTATDTADVDFEYSSHATPGTPATYPSRWHDSAATDDIWMAVRICKNGTWGSWDVMKIKGEDGRGISSITECYLASSSASGVTRSTSGWTTAIQSTTATKKYLWNYEVITYTDNTTIETNPHIIGVYGDQGNPGKGISSITNYYLAAASSSGVTTSTSGWTTSVQYPTATKKYLWNHEVITYTDNTTTTTAPHIIGVYGDQGNPGKGISSVTNYYLATASGSGITTSTSGWTTSVQFPTATEKYLWNYEVITYTDNTTTTIAPHIIGVYGDEGGPGDPGKDGKSFVPVYRNLDSTPAKPTGAALPPLGWREDTANAVTINSIERSPLSSWDFNLETKEVEYGVQYYALPGAGNDNLDSVAVVNFTTTKANQQLCIAIMASSEAQFDCIMVGQPDSETLPVRTNGSTYLAKASGNNESAIANVIVPAAGSHFIYVAYRKDSSGSKYNDFGYFRIAELPETLWMSIATIQGSTVLSWSDPIKMTAGRGERGAVPRMRNFAEGLLFMEGKSGEAYLDFAFYNNRYYRCGKTHISQEGETPYAAVQSANGQWTLETDYQFIASKVVWVGNGSEGWLIDEGRIYHSSGLIELSADGTIKTSNGNFSVDKNGNLTAMSGTFAGFLKIPFKTFAEGATYVGNGVYRVSSNFNLIAEGDMSGYEIVLELPVDASYSGTLLTIYDFPVKTRSSPTLTVRTTQSYRLLHPSKKGTYGLEQCSQIDCIRGGLLQLLAVSYSGYVSWVVVSDVMPDAVIS